MDDIHRSKGFAKVVTCPKVTIKIPNPLHKSIYFIRFFSFIFPILYSFSFIIYYSLFRYSPPLLAISISHNFNTFVIFSQYSFCIPFNSTKRSPMAFHRRPLFFYRINLFLQITFLISSLFIIFIFGRLRLQPLSLAIFLYFSFFRFHCFTSYQVSTL